MRRGRSSFNRGKNKKYGLTKFKRRGRRSHIKKIPKYGSSRGGIRL